MIKSNFLYERFESYRTANRQLDMSPPNTTPLRGWLTKVHRCLTRQTNEHTDVIKNVEIQYRHIR